MRQRTSGSGGVRSRGGQHGEGLQVVVHPREDRLVRHRLAEVGNRLAERDAEQAGSLDGSGGVGAADDRGEHLANAVAERPDGAGNDGVRLELECIGLPVLRGAGLGQQRFDHRQRAAAPCGVGRLGEPGGDPVQQHVCGGDALRGAELGELFDDADRVVGVLVGRAGVGPGELPEQVEHIGQQRVVGAGADAGQAGAAPADVGVGQPAAWDVRAWTRDRVPEHRQHAGALRRGHGGQGVERFAAHGVVGGHEAGAEVGPAGAEQIRCRCGAGFRVLQAPVQVGEAGQQFELLVRERLPELAGETAVLAHTDGLFGEQVIAEQVGDDPDKAVPVEQDAVCGQRLDHLQQLAAVDAEEAGERIEQRQVGEADLGQGGDSGQDLSGLRASGAGHAVGDGLTVAGHDLVSQVRVEGQRGGELVATDQFDRQDGEQRRDAGRPGEALGERRGELYPVLEGSDELPGGGRGQRCDLVDREVWQAELGRHQRPLAQHPRGRPAGEHDPHPVGVARVPQQPLEPRRVAMDVLDEDDRRRHGQFTKRILVQRAAVGTGEHRHRLELVLELAEGRQGQAGLPAAGRSLDEHDPRTGGISQSGDYRGDLRVTADERRPVVESVVRVQQRREVRVEEHERVGARVRQELPAHRLAEMRVEQGTRVLNQQ